MGRKKQILILAEGFEEKPYLDKILFFPVISKEYVFKVINVKGCGNIPGRYQNEYQGGRFELILVFCDADREIHDYDEIIKKVGKNFDHPEFANLLFIFANPVTLQIVLSHFGKVNLTSIGKSKNAEKVKELVGIDNYSAKQEQIDTMMSKVTFKNYQQMKINLSDVSTSIKDVPSTNILQFLEWFESDDTSWIDNINDKLSDN